MIRIDIKNDFINAIHNKKLVKIKYKSKSKDIIERECIPFDFGPSNQSKTKEDKYHFFSLNGPNGAHISSTTPSRAISIEILDTDFNPKDYVTWPNPKWHIPRDW